MSDKKDMPPGWRALEGDEIDGMFGSVDRAIKHLQTSQIHSFPWTIRPCIVSAMRELAECLCWFEEAAKRGARDANTRRNVQDGSDPGQAGEDPG